MSAFRNNTQQKGPKTFDSFNDVSYHQVSLNKNYQWLFHTPISFRKFVFSQFNTSRVDSFFVCGKHRLLQVHFKFVFCKGIWESMHIWSMWNIFHYIHMVSEVIMHTWLTCNFYEDSTYTILVFYYWTVNVVHPPTWCKVVHLTLSPLKQRSQYDAIELKY